MLHAGSEPEQGPERDPESGGRRRKRRRALLIAAFVVLAAAAGAFAWLGPTTDDRTAASRTAPATGDADPGPRDADPEARPTEAASPGTREDATSPTTTAPAIGQRLGLHVTDAELALWRRRAVRGPYVQAGDAGVHTPGDWERIVENTENFLEKPDKYVWEGPTHSWPRPIVGGENWPTGRRGMPGQRDERGAAESIRDAAFYAMVEGADQAPGARMDVERRTEILEEVKRAIQAMTDSPQNDFSNRSRYDPQAYGSAFHPMYQIARWLIIVAYAYDYAQVADPTLWTSDEKADFIRWLDDAATWHIPMIEQRREGMFDENGALTDEADEAYGPPLWSGGPRSEWIHARLDNHVPRLAQVPVLAGLLARLEQDRSGVETLSPARIGELLDHGRDSVEAYVKAELIAQAEGAGGGVATAGGNFYRWGDPPPVNGWKYAVSHLGRNLVLADHLARAGDLEPYTYATTAGTSVSAGSLPDDGLTDGGPKTLHGALRQLLRYIDEDSTPPRYGCRDCSDERHRIDSRDEIHDRHYAQEWEVLHANLFFRDPYVTSIYLRAEPGTPPLPERPIPGQGWAENGADGAFPGVNFMFAQFEDEVWPYPTPPPS